MVKLAVLSLVLLVAGPLLATLEVVPPMIGVATYALGGLLGLVAEIGGLVALVRGRGARALVLASVPAAIFVASVATGMGSPPINDVTTDVDDPPAFVHAQNIPANQGRDFAYPEDFKAVVRESYPDLKPLRIAQTPAQVYERAVDRARAGGSAVTREDRDAFTFEGVDTSRLFKFRDDFVVRVKPDGEGALVDMRSKSRDGIGDRGVNAERIRAFFADLGR